MGVKILNFEYWGIALTLFTYWIGIKIKEKYNNALLSPIIISIFLCIIVLLLGDIEYSEYQKSTKPISLLLTPSTAVLALSLHRQIKVLKQNAVAIFCSLVVGVLTSLSTILVGSLVFNLSQNIYISLLPKSITTAIGVGISEKMGGIVAITAVAIIITGIMGYIIIPNLCKFFNITSPVAEGIALGSASHVMGTAKAFELGEIQGAISSISIIISGLLTVLIAPLFVSNL